jgi:hypothetical protein
MWLACLRLRLRLRKLKLTITYFIACFKTTRAAAASG